MTNTSATGGYVVPDGNITAPLEDDALDDFLHDVVAGISGLANDLVRPRWQPDTPDLPPRATNWAAFGIMSRGAQTYAEVIHDSNANAGDGADILSRTEYLNLMCSFYGPNCQAVGAGLRDGLYIAQNREQLFLAGIALISVGELTKAPEMVKGQWLARADLPFSLAREVRREYPILNLLSASAQLVTSAGTSITRTAPPATP